MVVTMAWVPPDCHRLLFKHSCLEAGSRAPGPAKNFKKNKKIKKSIKRSKVWLDEVI